MTIATGSSGRWLALVGAAFMLAVNPALAQPNHGGGGGGSSHGGGAGHSGGAGHGGGAGHSGGAAYAGGAHGGGFRGGAGVGGGHAGRATYGGYAAGWHAPAPAHAVGHFAPTAHVGHGGYWRPRGGPGGGRWGHPRGGGGWWPWWSTGLFVAALPLYYNSFWWDGVPYYYGDNSYYVWNPDVSQYEVVPPPPAADPADAGAAPEELYAYPTEGQSTEQLVRDRQECRGWAAGQARGDGGAERRAEAACLEGRGYSVQ